MESQRLGAESQGLADWEGCGRHLDGVGVGASLLSAVVDGRQASTVVEEGRGEGGMRRLAGAEPGDEFFLLHHASLRHSVIIPIFQVLAACDDATARCRRPCSLPPQPLDAGRGRKDMACTHARSHWRCLDFPWQSCRSYLSLGR
jgi:hypothetical protein